MDMNELKTKRCTKCGNEKELKYFGRLKSTMDGYNYRCKLCRNEISNLYRSIYPERDKASRERCFENIQERKKLYRLNNIEKIRKHDVDYRAKTKEKTRQRKRKQVVELSNFYVRELLSNIGIKHPPNWLIDIKRQQLLLNRKLQTKENLS